MIHSLAPHIFLKALTEINAFHMKVCHRGPTMTKILALFLLGAALAGCASTDAEPQRPPASIGLAAEGRQIAETRCATCHAIGEGGASRMPEAPPFRTLSERYPVTALEEAFAEGILVGHPAMPEFRFEPHEIDAIIAYLQSVQTRRGG
jgi:mono/diheme cytochrome c family protein